MNIPRELVEQFARGNGVIFVGSRLSRGAGLPDLADLGCELASELDGCPANAGYREIASFFETEFNRNRLVQRLYDLYDTLDIHPTSTHEALIKIPVSAIFTTNYDDLLEKALRAAKLPFTVVVKDVHASFLSADRLQLVKLRGDLNQPESIVITVEDHDRYTVHQSALSRLLAIILQTRTVLFLGFDINDYGLRLILTQVRDEMRDGIRILARDLYTVQFGISPIVTKTMERRGLKVIDLGKQPDITMSNSVLHEWLQGLDRSIQKYRPVNRSVERVPRLSVSQLTNEVAGFLEAMGFGILELTWRNEYAMFRARGVVAGEDINRWYLCLGKEITPKNVRELQQRIDDTAGSKGWIVSHSAISNEVQKQVQTHPSIAARSLASFYHQILRYDDYILELIESSQEIEKYWVDLRCSYEEGTPFNLIEYVDKWLDSTGRNQLALSGYFGTGKTWFCRYYAARLARQHSEDPNRFRIPILISLREYTKALSIDQLITDTLVNTYQIDLAGGFETFMHLNRYGRLLLIFDGFDEMEQRVDYVVALRNYEQILRVVEKESKVILTSRPLSSLDGEGLSKPGFELLHLQAFDDEQIQDVLRKRVLDKWEECWEQISRIERLRNLASRPVMIQIISETLPAILDVGQIDSAALYQIYINFWFEKSWKMRPQDLLNIRDDVFFLVRDLAWDMFRSPVARTISKSELRERIKLELEPRLGPRILALNLEHLFVLDKGTGNYAFPHISFMEYLVADKVADSLSQGDGQSLFHCKLTDGVLEFLVDLIRSRSEAQVGILSALLSAQPGEQIDSLIKLLTLLGEGNPVTSILHMLPVTDYVEDLSKHAVEALGKDEFLNDAVKQLRKDLPPQIRHFLLELWGSPYMDGNRALRELTSVIHDNSIDPRVRLHAVNVLGKRLGKNEIQILIEAIGRKEMSMEIRQACIDTVKASSVTDSAIRRQVLNTLHEVINNDQDEDDFRRYCVAQLANYKSQEALQPLLSILSSFSHSLWYVAADTISQTNVLSLADEIERDIIVPNENELTLIRQITFLKAAVKGIRKIQLNSISF